MLCSTDAAIIEDPNADVSSFLVISYCWRNPSWNPVPAAQSTTLWGQSQPMVDKILSLRESKDEGIWIDQLCIDQENEEEKQIAIGSMDVIYRAARWLIIVLEDVELCDVEQEVGLKYASLYKSMCQIFHERQPTESEKDKLIKESFKVDAWDLVATKRFLLKLLSARWYSRAWCAHECKVSAHGKINNPLFLCFGSDGGVLNFEFRFIHYLALRTCLTGPDVPEGEEVLRALNDPTGGTSLYQRASRLMRLFPQNHHNASIMTDLVTISSYSCEKPTDRISIAMNARRIPLFFRGTINSPNVGYWILALASGDLGPLLLETNKLSICSNEETKSEVISWVDRPHNGPLDLQLPILSPETITSATIEYIELDLLLLQCQPMPALEASKNKARSIVASFNLLDRGHLAGAEDSISTSRMASVVNYIKGGLGGVVDKEWLIEFLGSAIDCGIDWIRQMPDRIANEAKSGAWSHGQFNHFDTGFTDAALDLLSYLGKMKETSPNFDVEFLQPVIRFFSYITDHRLKFSVLVPRKIYTSAACDFAFTGAISDRSWVAVPVAVAHLPFFHNRAWIVEPFEPSAAGEQSANPPHSKGTPDSARGHPRDETPPNQVSILDLFPVVTSDLADRRALPNSGGTWRIRKRQALVGCQPIVADGRAVVLLKKQKVYGSRDYDWAALMKDGQVSYEQWVDA